MGSAYDPLDVTEYNFEEIQAIVAVADNWGTYVASHINTDKAIQRAVKAGVKSIEHGFLIKEEETLQMMKDRRGAQRGGIGYHGNRQTARLAVKVGKAANIGASAARTFAGCSWLTDWKEAARVE